MSYSNWQQLDLASFRPVLDETISHGDEVLNSIEDGSLANGVSQYSNSSISGYWGNYQFNFKGSNFNGNTPTITSISFDSSVDSFKMSGKMTLSAYDDSLTGYFTNVSYTNLSTSSSFTFVGKGSDEYLKGTVSYTFSGNKYSYTGNFITDKADDTGMGISSGTVTGFSFEDTSGHKISISDLSIDYAILENLTNTGATINSLYSALSFDGNDTVTGTSGDDSLDGKAGVDTLIGGLGNDTYIVDLFANCKLQDKVTEAKNAGIDTLELRGDISLSKASTIKLVSNVENLDISLTNHSLLNLTGDNAANILTGNDTDNVIDGGKGADTLIGGAGNDTYLLDNAGDIVTEALDGGTDLVKINFTSGSYTLGDNVENGLITHAKIFVLNGNELSNSLTGGAGANTLNGGAGDDNLNGGKGNDILIGGTGNDILTGGVGADTFVFKLADFGVAGTPSVDVITDFSLKQKDVLDLRDLLPNANEDASIVNYIDVTTTGANTEIRISTTGGFAQGNYDASAENAHITLTGVNLLAGTDESSLLQTLMTKNQLLID